MSKYKQLIDQIASLQKQAEEVRIAEVKAVVDEIRQKMADYGITVEDLQDAPRARKANAKPVAPKYRNGKTGQTWSGRGKPPKWIVEAEQGGTSREKFLIK